MQEKRITHRLFKYWESVRKAQDLPDILRFNTGAIEDVWPYCFKLVVSRHGNSPSFSYEYMGKPVAELYGRDLTGLVVDQSTKQFPGNVIHHKFDEVLNAKVPLNDDGHLVNEKGELIKYRACILPFGSEKKGVTHIVVGLSCRFF
jgi:hypothetical protein